MSSLSLHRPATATRQGLALTRRLARWVEAHRSRKALALLDRHLLKDVGLESATARSEAQRPFWSL